MDTTPGLRLAFPIVVRRRAAHLLAGLGAFGLAIPAASAGDDREPRPSKTTYYSTARAPRDFSGPQPILLALNDPTASRLDVEAAVDHGVVRTQSLPSEPAAPTSVSAPASTAPPAKAKEKENDEVPRVASATGRVPVPALSQAESIARAKRAIAECQARFREVHDYTCTFQKRERIDGRLSAPHVMIMKARSEPNSLYFKFQTPNRGREAIYVAGRNHGKIMAHDVGLGKLVAGTMHLDPKGSMAMEENRHPITEAGLGHMIDSVARHWADELTPEESHISFHPESRVGNHPCTMIESVHPRRRADFMFHVVKLYIDREHGLPIRLEAYDWPGHPGAAPELVEEYSYLNLRVNVGLHDHDFDPTNKQYSFGRF